MQREPTEMPISLDEPISCWQETAPRVVFTAHLPPGADVVVMEGDY